MDLCDGSDVASPPLFHPATLSSRPPAAFPFVLLSRVAPIATSLDALPEAVALFEEVRRDWLTVGQGVFFFHAVFRPQRWFAAPPTDESFPRA